MSEELYTALYVFALLNLIDFMTTRIGLKGGAREMNPLARAVYERFGFFGLWAFKMIATGILPLIAYIVTGEVELSLWLWNAALGLVVANNSIQLWRMRRVRRGG